MSGDGERCPIRCEPALEFVGEQQVGELGLAVRCDLAVAALPLQIVEVDGGPDPVPDGPGGVRGYPKVVSSSDQSHDTDLQRRLWAVSEELTGVTYSV